MPSKASVHLESPAGLYRPHGSLCGHVYVPIFSNAGTGKVSIAVSTQASVTQWIAMDIQRQFIFREPTGSGIPDDYYILLACKHQVAEAGGGRNVRTNVLPTICRQ